MRISKKNIINVFIHISIWSLFFILPVLFFQRPQNVENLPPPSPVFVIIALSSIVLFMLIFYLNYYFLIPRLWRPYGRVAYLLGALVFMVALISLQKTIRYHLLTDFEPFAPYQHIFRRISLMVMVAFSILIWAVSTGLWLMKEWQSSEKRLRESEQKRVETELEQLKKQINPHFLFNTLNGIYALAVPENKQVANAVLQLSQLMSYVLLDAKFDFVDLEKDLNHLRHYIELNKLRLTEKSALELAFKGTFRGYTIAPLLLLPFVENAFKYGTSNVQESPIKISVEVKDHQLHLFVTNKIFPERLKRAQSTRLGISNTKRRLELVYPQNHQLTIEQTAYFKVHLQVNLKTHATNSSDQRLFS